MRARDVITVVLIVVTIFALLFAGTAYAVHRALTHAGTVVVRVMETEGENVCLGLPAAVLNTTIRAVLAGDRDGELEKLREWAPALEVMVDEMKKYPDFALVEIDGGNDDVTISSHHGALNIEVHNPDANVQVTLPSSTMDSIIRGALQ